MLGPPASQSCIPGPRNALDRWHRCTACDLEWRGGHECWGCGAQVEALSGMPLYDQRGGPKAESVGETLTL